MRGKIVNLCIALMNLLFGALIIVYTLVVPQDKTLITVQENIVIGYVLITIYALMFIIGLIDAIQSYYNRSDTAINAGYIIGIFVISFFFIKQPAIACFSIISGLIVAFQSLKENLVELNSTTVISISIVIMCAILSVGTITFNYEKIGISIRNRENKNELAYKEDYFKYITELDINDIFINVKKDGKFGYINKDGNVMIDFKYDYASPFVNIMEFGKRFQVALVCGNGRTELILKNGRVVLSYRTESSDENYKAKLMELENIYKNTLKQSDEMQYEIGIIKDNINRVPAYNVESNDYTYKYNYNYEYDVIITQSNMGRNDVFEFIKKDDSNIKIRLNTSNLDYDENYLYLFSNGTIPFYEISKRTQGWYTSYGKKNEMTGKAQILDFFGDRILLKNYNENKIYFINQDGKKLSESYADIFVVGNGRYIVKNLNNYFKIIDDDYNNIFEKEYAAVNTRLIEQNLYLTLDSTENIKFNDYGFAYMNWKLLNENGDVILENIEQIYDQVFELPKTNKRYELNYYEFQDNLKELEYNFVGDKFYLDY